MIKINLVSREAGVSAITADAGSGSRDEAIKRGFLLFLGPLALYVFEMQNIPSRQADLSNKKASLQQLVDYNSKQKDVVAEIKKFKEDEALIESRILALEKISKDRSREVRVMDLMQTVIPEKAWLTRLEMNGVKINIQGLALSDFEITSFLDSLSKSVFLTDVNLVSSNEVSQEGSVLKKFEISCLLERPQ